MFLNKTSVTRYKLNKKTWEIKVNGQKVHLVNEFKVK